MDLMRIVGSANDQDVRPYSRRMLESTLSRTELIAAISFGPTGEPIPHTMDWWTYWHPIRQTSDRTLIGACSALRGVWNDYIQSAFRADLLPDYCRAYFSLLESVLAMARSRGDGDRSAHSAVRTTIAFECFPVGRLAQASAAATTTHRNLRTFSLERSGRTCLTAPPSYH